MNPVLFELRMSPASGRILAAATTAWTVAVVLAISGHGAMIPAGEPLLLGIPVVVFAFALLSETSVPLRASAAWIALLVLAIVFGYLVQFSILFALAPAAILASAIACSRFPALATVTVFGLTGGYVSLQAFTGLSGTLLADLALGGLWAGVILRRLTGSHDRLPVWPAVGAIGTFLGLTLFQVIAGEDPTRGVLSARITGWYMLAILLVAYGGWDRLTYRRIARGVVAMAGLMGAYATFRYFVGPTTSELQLASQIGGAYNYVEGGLRVFGGLGSGHQLGFWAGATAPFCLAAALTWRGKWQLLAISSTMLTVFAELASEVRGSFVGVVVGFLLVLVLYQLARGMPGLHLGKTLTVGLASLLVIGGSLVVTADGPGRIDRYVNILHPSQDAALSAREDKWSEAIADIGDHPFGQGVGSASPNPSIRKQTLSIATNNLDNSYLKIAFEQGFAVMVFFVLALLALLARIVLGAIRTPDPEAAGIGIGAAGTLASTLIVFYTGIYVENLIALGSWIIVGLGIAFLLRAEKGFPATSG